VRALTGTVTDMVGGAHPLGTVGAVLAGGIGSTLLGGRNSHSGRSSWPVWAGVVVLDLVAAMVILAFGRGGRRSSASGAPAPAMRRVHLLDPPGGASR